MPIIRKRLYASEGIQQNQRYNEVTETFQTTYDGGATWVNTPSADPRFNPDLINPEAGIRCDVAQGFSNFVREFVDGSLQTFNVTGITSWAINIGLLFMPGIALFYRLALIIADGIVAIGSVTLQEVFDEELYDQIREIAYCHIDDEGHFSEADWNAIGEDLQTFIGGSTSNIVFAAMYNLYGWVGFQNKALALAESAVCTGEYCELNCVTFDEPIGVWDQLASGGSQDMAFGNPAPSIHGSQVGNSFNASVRINLPTERIVTAVEFDIYWHSSLSGNPTSIVYRGARLEAPNGTVAQQAPESGAPTEPMNTWVRRRFTFTYAFPVSHIRAELALQAAAPLEGWIDNVCLEYGD